MGEVLYVSKFLKFDDLRMFADELLEDWMQERSYVDSLWYESSYEELFYLNNCNAARLSDSERETVFRFLGL
jgi:hypothetical protein